jgi:hypothetical protein
MGPYQKVEWLALEFLERTLYPSPAGAPLTTCFIRDGVITEWPYSLSLRSFRRRSCRPFHVLVMMKSIHRTGGDSCLHTAPGTASTFGLKLVYGMSFVSSQAQFRFPIAF